jgi:hypothetical protein
MNAADKIAQATAAGYKAAEENRSRAPAMDKTLMSLIGGPVGTNEALFKAFSRGYQKRCDEEAAAVLAD